LDEGLRLAVANAINLVFLIAFVSAVIALVAVFFALTDKPSPAPVSAD
jgi:hypothetical protein